MEKKKQYNLQILEKSNLVKSKEAFESIIKENNELVAIFTASIKTTSS